MSDSGLAGPGGGGVGRGAGGRERHGEWFRWVVWVALRVFLMD